jgi:hypothetical protein
MTTHTDHTAEPRCWRCQSETKPADTFTDAHTGRTVQNTICGECGARDTREVKR